MIVGQAHISYWPLDKLAKIIPQLLLIVKVVVHFLFTDSQMIYVQMRRYRVPVRDGAWPPKPILSGSVSCLNTPSP